METNEPTVIAAVGNSAQNGTSGSLRRVRNEVFAEGGVSVLRQDDEPCEMPKRLPLLVMATRRADHLVRSRWRRLLRYT